jgi:2,4-didehydro-3-deoxy-L-rhamnonate hydrolase
MGLMCIGAAGTERSIVRVDDEGYIDLSEAVRGYDEAFFEFDGPRQLRNIVARRRAGGHNEQQIRRMCVDDPHELLDV